jgi:hypothetical protein
MLPIARLVNGTLDDAIDYVAGRAAAARTGNRTYAEKRAVAASDVLTSLGQKFQDNPVLGKALLGGGLGAAVGAGAHLAIPDAPGRKKSSLLSKVMMGGLTGAGIGAGAGTIQRFRAGETPAVEPTTFEMGGKKWQVDPKLLKEDPEYLSKVQKLTKDSPMFKSQSEGGAWPEGGTLPSKVMDFITKNPFAPTTTPFVLPTMAADVALHNRTLRLGDRNWLTPIAKPLEWAGKLTRPVESAIRRTVGTTKPALGPGESWGERAGAGVRAGGEWLKAKGLTPGAIKPESYRGSAEDVRRGAERLAAGKEVHPAMGDARDLLKDMLANKEIQLDAEGRPVSGHELLERVRKDPNAEFKRTIMEEKKTSQPAQMHDVEDVKTVVEGNPELLETLRSGRPLTAEERVALGKGRLETSKRKVVIPQPETIEHVPKTQAWTKEHTARLNTETARDVAERLATAHGTAVPVHPPGFRYGLGMGDTITHGPMYRGGRLGGRLALYAGVPLAEAAIRSYASDVARHRTLQEMVEEARAKGQLREVH